MNTLGHFLYIKYQYLLVHIYQLLGGVPLSNRTQPWNILCSNLRFHMQTQMAICRKTRGSTRPNLLINSHSLGPLRIKYFSLPRRIKYFYIQQRRSGGENLTKAPGPLNSLRIAGLGVEQIGINISGVGRSVHPKVHDNRPRLICHQ